MTEKNKNTSPRTAPAMSYTRLKTKSKVKHCRKESLYRFRIILDADALPLDSHFLTYFDMTPLREFKEDAYIIFYILVPVFIRNVIRI